jgi:FkbM family methyltransferase
MHISAWNYPIFEKNNKTFLSKIMHTWGWGTWKRAWKFFNTNIDFTNFSLHDIYKFNLENQINYWEKIVSQKWEGFWYASILRQNGLCLNPYYPLVEHHPKYLNQHKNFIFTTEEKTLSLNKINPVKEHQKLKQIPRFVETEVNFFEKNIKVPDAASFLFLVNELFQKEIYKFNTKNKTPLIIDCGANIGMSVLFFNMLYPNAKIIAFEPDPKILKYLKFNLKIFNVNATIIPKALWDKETTLTFYSEGADGGRIDTKGDNIIKVKTTILSKYLKNNYVDFLKIDIEGAEATVLEEAKNYLTNVEYIYIEYHSFVNKKQNLDKILSILSQAGFRYYIEHIGIKSKYPFIKINTDAGFDNQLHIFAYKDKK